DLLRILIANVSGSLAFSIAAFWFIGPRVPRSIYFIDCLVCFLAMAAAPICVRIYYEGGASDLSKPEPKGLLIYGAGMAGVILLNEIRANPSLGYKVIGFLDDDPNKRQAHLGGAPVLGAGGDVRRVLEGCRNNHRRIDEILIAIPSATGHQMQEVLAHCHTAGVSYKTIPSLAELLSGRVLSGQIRDVAITDLLGRKPIWLEE